MAMEKFTKRLLRTTPWGLVLAYFISLPISPSYNYIFIPVAAVNAHRWLSIDLFVSLLRGYKSVRNEEFAWGLENLEDMYLWYVYSKDRTRYDRTG